MKNNSLILNIGYNYDKSFRKNLPINHRKESMNEVERRECNRKVFLSIKKEDNRLSEDDRMRLRNGVCPKCHSILPNSGICDCE